MAVHQGKRNIWLAIIPIVLAIIGLIFGDNLLERYTGYSVLESLRGKSSSQVPPISVPPQSAHPLREHRAVSIGTGAFTTATFSDGMAPYDENWLWANKHFNIQRIRREENPDGCGSVQYQVDRIWIGVAAIARVTVNGTEIGTITTITPLQKHGYIVDVSLNIGDTICVSPIPTSGFQIIFGPDIYYHHDSYCYRGGC